MRCWWVLALACGCPGKPSKPKPHDAAVLRDAMIDAAIAMTPQPDEVAVPGPAPFYIDKRETTIADYRKCVDANMCAKTARGIEIHGKHPEYAMGGVTLYEARAYCAWKGKRLPTPAEWNRAAYGDDARKYPWGDEAITCERAVNHDCTVEEPIAPGGRPAGASAFGAEDMLGNVEEWTDPGVPAFPAACVTKPSDRVDVLGGAFGDAPDSPSFVRDNKISYASGWFDNRDQGIRCARGPVPPPPASTDPVLGAATWDVEAMASSEAAIEDVAVRCKAGQQALWIAGEHVGKQGWVVAREGTGMPAPKDLVRVVGIATCDFAEITTLVAKVGTQKLRVKIPSDIGIYQLWAKPGTWLELELACKAPPDRGECSFATMLANPARFRVPMGPMSGVEGPALVGTGGMTCD